MGRMKLAGRTRDHAVSILLVAVVAGGAWKLGLLDGLAGSGSGSGGDGRGTSGPDLPEITTPEAEDDGDVDSLDMGDFDPGDCIFYRTDVVGSADTHLVDCAEDHRIQLTARVDLDFESVQYPSDDEWVAAIDDKCGPAAEELLGRPLDPYGRFTARAIRPTAESWDNGDRDEMWCGIGWVGPLDGSDEDQASQPLFAEDVRGADPGFHHPAGTCLALGDEMAIVDCTEPHGWEVSGEIDLRSRTERPVGAQQRALADDCYAETRAYLGADPVAPWSSGYETLAEESWAAGTRSIHCFVGQWDSADEIVEVTGSAKA